MKKVLKWLWRYGIDSLFLTYFILYGIWTLTGGDRHGYLFLLTAAFLFSASLSDYRYREQKGLADAQRKLIAALTESRDWYREQLIEALPTDTQERIRKMDAEDRRVQ